MSSLNREHIQFRLREAGESLQEAELDALTTEAQKRLEDKPLIT
jgi:hypothetical protein